ncbi:MAG: SDR family oxidoreductase [Bdellovibrionales bacterium]|nr:SDR family oxidoreductase [Bdellovibrionales bacterium]
METSALKNDLSIKDSYAGKTILIAGASGYLGKVFLALVLEKLPDVKKIYILLRKRRLRSSRDRFEQMINRSFVFHNLHERYGAKLTDYISKRVEMLEGDVVLPNLGLSSASILELRENLDLFVNSAGLVDFNPDLREAVAINIKGTLACAEFVKSCKKARFLHVSTCFVSGQKNGRFEERVTLNLNPIGKPFDAEAEYVEITKLVEAHTDANDSLESKRQIREEMVKKGMIRAKELGWTNTYTYTKGISEHLLKLRYPDLPVSILRPSIVESSISFPFPGWNEGFNTCGPLAHLLSTWFRYLPAKKGNPFDVIPVDQVAKAMALGGMELLCGTHKEVYQAASSDLNPLSIDQAAELTSLSHQQYFRRQGRGFWQRWVRPWWRVKSIGNSFHPMGAKQMKLYCHLLSKLCRQLKMHALELKFARYEKKWGQILNVLELFRPFIHDYRQVYVTQNLTQIHIKEKDMRFDPKSWDWKIYWQDIHMPGLRRWCFPVIRRETVESLNPIHPFYWPTPAKVQTEISDVKSS